MKIIFLSMLPILFFISCTDANDLISTQESSQSSSQLPSQQSSSSTYDLSSSSQLNSEVSPEGNCSDCHNTTIIHDTQFQFNNSRHSEHFTTSFNSNPQCITCHSHEGFLNSLIADTSDSQHTLLNTQYPSEIRCGTCHTIHTVYNNSDWALRINAEDSITLAIDGNKYSFGSGNICATCHQSRESIPASTDSIIINEYYGPHHGSQSLIIKGIGAAALPGNNQTALPTDAPHADVLNSCVNCHMATEADDSTSNAGGHTLDISMNSTNLLTGCKNCHSSETMLQEQIKSTQTEVDSLLTLVKTLLTDKGLDGTIEKKVIGSEAAALWNYKLILEDNSVGVHNPEFVRTILENTIKFLEK